MYGHNKSTDIWSIGIIAYEIAYGELPFGFSKVEVTSELKRNIKNDL